MLIWGSIKCTDETAFMQQRYLCRLNKLGYHFRRHILGDTCQPVTTTNTTNTTMQTENLFVLKSPLVELK